MTIDSLIEGLARDATPIAPRAVEHLLATGAVVGAGLTLLAVTVGLGPRPDLGVAVAGSAFWGKAAYPLSLGFAAFLLTWQLARPDSHKLRRPWLVLVPVAALLLAALPELMGAAPRDRADLLIQPTWTCVPLILLLSVPIYSGLVLALRRLAPTRLAAAGAAAGLAAGGFAAALYCLYCQQASPTFLVTRYTAAIVLASAVGALLGPRVLRW